MTSKCKGSSTSNCHADHPVLLEPLGHQGLQLLGREEVARETSKKKSHVPVLDGFQAQLGEVL